MSIFTEIDQVLNEKMDVSENSAVNSQTNAASSIVENDYYQNFIYNTQNVAISQYSAYTQLESSNTPTATDTYTQLESSNTPTAKDTQMLDISTSSESLQVLLKDWNIPHSFFKYLNGKIFKLVYLFHF